MATYLILNILFIVFVLVVLRVRPGWPRKRLVYTAAALLLLTLVFDNLIISMAIVDYDPAKILGITLGEAPIEDFMYAVLAVIIVPVLWGKMSTNNE